MKIKQYRALDSLWVIVAVVCFSFVINLAIPFTGLAPKGISECNAQRGCCSYHGGVSGCDTSVGRQVCNDGTYSPSCGCQIVYVYGCMNYNALNYNPKATKDNGTCKLKTSGCMDKTAINYNPSANTNDFQCQFKKQIVVEEPIFYDLKYIDNPNSKVGVENTLKEGTNGISAVTYTITTNNDGAEISRVKASELVKIEPLPKEVSRGTMPYPEYYLGVIKQKTDTKDVISWSFLIGVVLLILNADRIKIIARNLKKE